MIKRYLLAPGPTPLPESVVANAAQPIIHHRTPQFSEVFERCREGLKYVFQTKEEVLMLSSSGSGAMNAAVCNIFKKGDPVITVNCGKFGDRWTKIAKAYGLNATEIKTERGSPVTMSEIEKAYKDSKAKAILFQASETSTGVMNPTKEIVEFCKKNGMLSIVDAVTAAGVFDLPMDKWGIDVMVSGSQKAFMIPPGMAFIAMSDRAWEMAESSDLPRFYFNLRKEKDSHAKGQSAWTPAITLVQALDVSLGIIREEGLENVFKRHELQALATRNAVQALGLELLSKSPSPAVTAIKVPDGVEGKAIPKTMRDKYGVTIAGGQDELAGKIFRLSHFGYCGKWDITTGISCLELVLHELGYKVEFGKGVGAVIRTFAEGK